MDPLDGPPDERSPRADAGWRVAVPDALVLDAPAPGARCSDALALRGWALRGGLPVLPDLVTTAQGGLLPAAFWPSFRPDVARSLGGDPRAPYGWEGVVDLGALGDGVTELRIAAFDQAVELAVEHVPSGLRIELDRPVSGSVVTASGVWLAGWAHDAEGRAPAEGTLRGASLDVPLEVGVGRRTSGGSEELPPGCGWEVQAELADWTPARSGLAVVVSAAGGGEAAVVLDVMRPVEETEPRVVLERLERREGELQASGFTVWPAPAPVTPRAVLVAGGRALTAAPADRSRPDVTRTGAGARFPPRCGFRITAADPDPGAELQLRVQVVDAAGRVALSEPHVLAPAPSGPGGGRGGDAAALRALTRPGEAVLDLTGSIPAGVRRVVAAVGVRDGRLPQHDGAFPVVVADAVDREEAARVAARLVLVRDRGSGEFVPEERGADGTGGSVSIVIPVHGQAELTAACLAATLASVPTRMEAEVIVVDDASPDPATRRVLAEAAEEDPRLTVVALEENAGFLRATNLGAERASGARIVLLNNDTRPVEGWLEALLGALGDERDAGAAGARLRYPDGRLQEAGAAVFRDGSAAQIGHGSRTPDHPLLRMTRPADYCSAAALALPLTLWRELGGFDERYAPAFYEDVDLCFRIRAAGARVLVVPAAEVVHHHGGSMGLDEEIGLKRHQRLNQEKFSPRWSAVLATHPERPAAFGTDETTRALVTGAWERDR